ncbi:MAG: hypothetical protein K2Q34_01375 [Alphaproteobacteria bacterium]|nr:hypothetical protein [Alphaproteobacteria bacterium]
MDEIQLEDTQSLSFPSIDVRGIPGALMGVINLNEVFDKAASGNKSKAKQK